jgi:hypothetical protein
MRSGHVERESAGRPAWHAIRYPLRQKPLGLPHTAKEDVMAEQKRGQTGQGGQQGQQKNRDDQSQQRKQGNQGQGNRQQDQRDDDDR